MLNDSSSLSGNSLRSLMRGFTATGSSTTTDSRSTNINTSTNEPKDSKDEIVAELIDYTSKMQADYEKSLRQTKDDLLVVKNELKESKSGSIRLKAYVKKSKYQLLATIAASLLAVGGVYVFIDSKITANTEKVDIAVQNFQNKVDEHVAQASTNHAKHAGDIGGLKSDVSSLMEKKQTINTLVSQVATNSANLVNVRERLNLSETVSINVEE